MATIDEMFKHVAEFRAQSIRDKCQSDDDAVMLASQFAFQAAQIYETLGGKSLAAAQFYRIADQLAAETPSAPAGKPSHR